jgi:hypothetical protein
MQVRGGRRSGSASRTSERDVHDEGRRGARSAGLLRNHDLDHDSGYSPSNANSNWSGRNGRYDDDDDDEGDLFVQRPTTGKVYHHNDSFEAVN